ncbi:hypothetical protein VBD025_16400 [Virgibacillus flavescens]|uniref:hypothetical protein n=1 Tax=Virgibacillus flavescens TaxID=1611422 RepID=UPI003D33B558
MKNNILLNFVLAIIFFGLFITGMVFSEEYEILMLLGIIGLGGFAFFVFRVVTVSKVEN